MYISNEFIKANDLVATMENKVPAPYFRKSFELDFVPLKAEITVCGLGFYELYINGVNITKGPLAPYISNPDDVCYYDNYDITKYLVKGKNAVALILGNGFRNPYGGFIWDFDKALFIGPVTLALCLEVSGEGKEFKMEADESFKTHSSPILWNDIRMGFGYDSNLEINGWNLPDFDDSSWDNAKKCTSPKGVKKICEAEPIAVMKEIAPVKITHYDKLPFAYESHAPGSKPLPETVRENVYVYDFGENGSGVTKLKINGKKGQKITIRHSDSLNQGKFTINNIMFMRDDPVKTYYFDYGQVDEFILKGGEEELIPRFKFDGFQYAYVEGLEEEQATKDALTYIMMSSDLKERASFECSDEVINTFQRCARRSDLSNFFYFPLDCPHREKNGWTGDASMSSEHMLLNLTPEKSFKEWLLNIRKSQNTEGAIPGIVPTGGWGFAWGNGPTWDSVMVHLPYYTYKYTGDTQIIEENMSMIMRYLTYVYGRRDEKGLVHIGLGEWCDPFKCEENGYKVVSPLEVTDSIMVYNIAKKAEFLFDVIGRKNEKNYAKAIAEEMKETIRKELIDDDLVVLGNCQTSQTFALATGIFNDDEFEKASKKLVEIIHRDGDINTCGMIGLRYIYHILSKIGESDLAFDLITNKSRSCYGNWLIYDPNMTTLYENFVRYDGSISSKNHHFLGDMTSWFIQCLAGLKPNPNVNDITYFEISPSFVKKLDYAKAHYNSVCGKIFVNWERKNKKIVLKLELPKGTKADIILPKGYAFENGDKTQNIVAKENISLEKIIVGE